MKITVGIALPNQTWYPMEVFTDEENMDAAIEYAVNYAEKEASEDKLAVFVYQIEG